LEKDHGRSEELDQQKDFAESGNDRSNNPEGQRPRRRMERRWQTGCEFVSVKDWMEVMAGMYKTFEIVFTKRCFPPSRFIKADRYEIRGEEVVFIYAESFVVDRESVYDIKKISEVAPVKVSL
jgi:hypothetical protein